METRFEMFTVLIAKASRYIYKIKTEEMREFDLKSSHVSCLSYLYKAGSLTAKELCDVCCEDKANISRALKFLEANGFLQCNSTQTKRYKSAMSLTDKGKEIAKHIVEKIDSILQYASAGLSEEHRQIMYQSLSLINDNLYKLCNGYDIETNEENNEK